MLIAVSLLLSIVRISAEKFSYSDFCLLSPMPIIIAARRHGTHAGVSCGLAVSVGVMLIHFRSIQNLAKFENAFAYAAFSFIAAYSVMGLSSVFSARKHAESNCLTLGVLLTFLLRIIFILIGSAAELYSEQWAFAIDISVMQWAGEKSILLMLDGAITLLAAVVINSFTCVMDRKGMVIDAPSLR